ncbi:MAG: hypothetical protein NVSMB9_03580 [Isosphaeraceae bacterium]
MAAGSEEKTDAEIYGLPLNRFKAAVDAVVDLRDTGKLLIFLTRRGQVKLIGEIEDFRRAFITQTADESIDVNITKKAQEEIRHLSSVIVRMSNLDSVLEYMERIYLQDLSEKDDQFREEFKRRQRPKVEMVSDRIVTPALRQKANRLATATAACVEELDYEVVSSRVDTYRERTIKDAFLRMRLRYTEPTNSEFPFYSYFFVSLDALGGAPAAGFEFECDLSDIDLLLKRLQAAKQRLLELQEPEATEK